MTSPAVAVTGLHAGDNPRPGCAVIRSLRRHFPDLGVVGLVYDALESGVFAEHGPDAAYTIPYPAVGWRAWMERLDFIRAHHPFTILIPTLDAEIEPLALHAEALEARGIRTLLPTLESYRARAKTSLAKTCADCNCVTPESWLAWDVAGAAEAASALGYPVMLKGQYYDAKQARTEAELVAAFHEMIGEWGVPVIVQESVAGGEFNVAGVGDGAGGVTGLFAVRKLLLSSAGKGQGSVTVHEPRIERMTRDLVAALAWRGPFELELIHDEATDRFLVIEMNPRFPAWIDFASACGTNFPAQVVALLDGLPPPPSSPPPVGRFFLRHQVELVGSVEDWARLATEGAWTPRCPS
ncbi:MAG: hypothetical protein ACKOZU_03510 [Planctomycetaceae bacterium]